LKIEAGDGESGVGDVRYALKEDDREGTELREFVLREPGTYQVSFEAEDRVGNRAESDSYSVVIDGEAPLSTVSTAEHKDRSGASPDQEGAPLYLDMPNRIEIRSRDAGVGTEYIEASYDGRKFFRVTKEIDPARWKEPERALYFRSVDRLGNQEPTRKIV